MLPSNRPSRCRTSAINGKTLPPGTVILTGTPRGVGMAAKPPRWLKPGDVVTIEIDFSAAMRRLSALGYEGWVYLEYVGTDGEGCKRCDNISESLLLRDLLRALD